MRRRTGSMLTIVVDQITTENCMSCVVVYYRNSVVLTRSFQLLLNYYWGETLFDESGIVVCFQLSVKLVWNGWILSETSLCSHYLTVFYAFHVSHCYSQDEYDQMALRSWVNVVCGKMTAIDRLVPFIILHSSLLTFVIFSLFFKPMFEMNCWLLANLPGRSIQ